MTLPELAEIRKRCDAATPGPWGSPMNLCWTMINSKLEDVPEGDEKFIAHARTDVPKLLAEIDQLRQAIQLMAAQCGIMDAGDACRMILQTAKKALCN